jgi:hypothetical protein
MWGGVSPCGIADLIHRKKLSGMQVTDEVSLGGWSRVRSYPAAMMMRWSERRQDLDLGMDGSLRCFDYSEDAYVFRCRHESV